MEFHVKYFYHFFFRCFEGYFVYKGTIKGLYYISKGVERGFFSLLFNQDTNYRYGFYVFSDDPAQIIVTVFWKKNIFYKIRIIVTIS